MGNIFLWFYCLDIPDAVLLIALATLGFLALRIHFRERKYWKAAVAALLICWLGVILLGTVGNRSGEAETSEPVLIPFYSYYLAANGGSIELYRTNFMNAVLFYPAGLLGFEALPRRWSKAGKAALVLAALLMLSVGIEYCQYRFSLGLVEADDVIHNSLGALLGILASQIAWKHS